MLESLVASLLHLHNSSDVIQLRDLNQHKDDAQEVGRIQSMTSLPNTPFAVHLANSEHRGTISISAASSPSHN